ncbi:MAG TPA: hypothetical protein VFS26_09195 [Solirubrobacterales bacterium]|nr:hypothetical protein [Solirubrobacterales bacterium]
MNKRSGRYVGVIAAMAVAAGLLVGGIAAAEKPITSIQGDIHTEFNGGFSPKTLSKRKLTPISFWISGKLSTLSGEHIPPLKEFILEGDKHASLSVKGIPICNSRKLQQTTTAKARKVCGSALIGSGQAEAEIKFPDQPPIEVRSDLLAFNGGFKGGVTTLYLHAYITVPTPATIITVTKVKRVKKGRYGLQSVSTIPKIAAGSGSVTFFKLNLKKGILSATCPDGHLNARGTAVFGSLPPTKLSGAVVRPCTGKG